jgi:agmatinase
MGVDVVEVSPPYDHAEITAYLGNRVVLEALSGMAARKVGITHDPAGPLLDGRRTGEEFDAAGPKFAAPSAGGS